MTRSSKSQDRDGVVEGSGGCGCARWLWGRGGRWVLLVALLVLVVAGRLCVGQKVGWPGGDAVGSLWRVVVGGWVSGVGIESILDLRMLRVLLAVVVGAALATSGVGLQALLRNPLAEPFVLGLTSGAGVGVMAQLMARYTLGVSMGGLHVGAVVGALVSMLVVYSASQRRGVLDPLGLLLVGVVLGTINGSLIMILNYASGPAGLRVDLARWMMGYLNEGVVGSPSLVIVGGFTLFGVGLLMVFGPAMDVATFSEVEAEGIGVDVRRLRVVLFAVSSVLAGGAVVLGGPIAFVGLICPHAARLLLGPGHRALVPGAAIAGAVLVVLADTAAVAIDRWRGIGLLPIGVFTALLGGPVFVWMLRSRIGRAWEMA